MIETILSYVIILKQKAGSCQAIWIIGIMCMVIHILSYPILSKLFSSLHENDEHSQVFESIRLHEPM